MRLLSTLVLISATSVAFAQNPGKADPKQTKPQTNQQPQTQAQPQQQQVSPMLEHYIRKYATAIRWNDREVAKSTLYDIIVENPANDSLIYSLAYDYYENQQFPSALLICQDLLNRDPKNLYYLEMAATAAEAMGAMERSLQHYESLYLLTNDVSTLYRIAYLQYSLKRFAEATTNTDILMGKPEAGTLKLIFNDTQGKQKEYVMKVALMNLKGLIALEQNDKAGAKKHFSDALALAPDFALAKENLEKTK